MTAVFWTVFLLAFAPLRNHLQAQDYDRYQPIQCAGPIPEELRTSSSKKYAQELEALGDSATGKAGHARDNFLLQSNFVLDEMLLSGRVVFGDPVSEYVTRVKNLILRDQPALQKEIRIYLVKSPVVNAFATNSGILLVNMGLIAHLKTEAELAFVLCHEIQHYIHKHPINNYVNAENLKTNARMLGLNNTEDYIMARTRYSRTLELDADASGFDLYKKSGYSLTAAEGVFDLLDYAEQPFDQLPWDAGQWEWEYMRFPASYFKWTPDTVNVIEDDEDTMSTHPNIARRRAVILQRISEAGEDKGESFLIGADLFLDARKRCRFELSDLYLSNHDYERAIYNSHLLQTEEPESHYLRKVIALSLYGLVTFKNERRFVEIHIDDDDVQGGLQQLSYFTGSTDSRALNILALHEVWKQYLADTTDIELRATAMELVQKLFEKHRRTTELLAHEKPKVMPGRIDSLMQARRVALENVGKPIVAEDEKSKEGESGKKSKTDYDNIFLEWALTDLFENEHFADIWAAGVEESKMYRDEEYVSPGKMKELTTREKLRGLHLDIQKIVLVQPIYKSVDMREQIPVQYIASEAALETYKETLAEMAKRNDIEFQFLENRNLDEDDVTQFNDVSTTLLWFGDHLNGSDEKIQLLNFRQDEANALIARYGTPYFAWNGVIQVTDKMDSWTQTSWFLVGCIILPMMPVALYKILKPQQQTMFVTLVVDLKNSQAIWEDYRILKAKDKRPIVRTVLYDTFFQIGGKR